MISNGRLAALIVGGATPEAVEAALEHPVSWTRERVRPDHEHRNPEEVRFFLRQWLRALPPMERLQAAEQFPGSGLRLRALRAATQSMADELRSFGTFTDGPDAEVDESIMIRLGSYAAQLDAAAVVLGAAGPESTDDVDRSQDPDDKFFREQMHDRARRGPVVPNDLMALLGAGRLDEAVRLALHHRTDWVELRLDYDAVGANDLAVWQFLPRWLAALPALERLQAASWATGHYLMELVYLDHAYGVGAQLLLNAHAAAAGHLAISIRACTAATSPEALGTPGLADQLHGYADQLEAMSFEPIPVVEADRATP